MKKDTLKHLQKHLKSIQTYLEKIQEKNAERKGMSRLDVALVIILVLCVLVVVIQTPHEAQAAVQKSIANFGNLLPTAPPSCTGSNKSCEFDSSTAIGDLVSPDYSKSLGDWLVNNDGHGAVFATDLSFTIENDKIQRLWQAMVTLVTGCMAIILMVTGYRIMGKAIGFRYADALEALSHVFFAIIAVALSGFFVAFLLFFANGFNHFVVLSAQALQPTLHFTDLVFPVTVWDDWLFLFLLMLLMLLVAVLIIVIPGINAILAFFGATVAVTAGLGVFLISIRGFVMVILSMMLTFQLLARLIAIDLYIILGPLALGCWALGLTDVARKWVSGILSLIFIQSLQVICLSIGTLFFHPLPTLGFTDQSTFDFNTLIKQASTLAGTAMDLNAIMKQIPDLLGPVAVLWLTLRVPRMLGSSALGPVITAGQTVTSTVVNITGLGGAR